MMSGGGASLHCRVVLPGTNEQFEVLQRVLSNPSQSKFYENHDLQFESMRQDEQLAPIQEPLVVVTLMQIGGGRGAVSFVGTGLRILNENDVFFRASWSNVAQSDTFSL